MSKTKLQKTPWGFRPAHWKMLSWNSFATPSGEPITVAPDSRAKQVTVRVRHKGVVERRGKKNQPRVIRNLNQTQISAGQFIISRIDARNGACGIVPKELEGAIVTKDFRVFDIDSTILLTSYLDYLIGLPVFWKLCSFVSDGTTNRVRLDMELFDQMRFPIPPLIEQEIAVNTLQSIDDTLKRTEHIIITAEQLREAILHKLLTFGLPGHHKEWKGVPSIGTIPATWQVVKLDDIVEIIGGSTPSRKVKEYWGCGIPWVVPSELTGLAGNYLTSTEESITEAGLQSSSLKIIPPNSILLTTRATIGITAINLIPVTTNQGFQNLVPNAGIDTLWLYYYISFIKKRLIRRASGSTFLEISRDNIRSLTVSLPSLSEQISIATVVNSIDILIESYKAERDTMRTVYQSLIDYIFSVNNVASIRSNDIKVESE